MGATMQCRGGLYVSPTEPVTGDKCKNKKTEGEPYCADPDCRPCSIYGTIITGSNQMKDAPNAPDFNIKVEDAKALLRETAEVFAALPGMKASNPKDAIGSDKMPLHLWPGTATIMGSLGLLEGMLKYGRANWREAGVKASIYFDALARHSLKLFEGEDVDSDSGLPHECHMLACIAIIIDAKAAGKFIDDRQYPGGFHKLLAEMTPHVARLKAKYADRTPHHYTIADTKE